MPRNPDVRCAGTCGRLLWGGGRGSLASGQRMCRNCRTAGRPSQACTVCGDQFPACSYRTCPKCRTPHRSPGTLPSLCGEVGCDRPSRSRGLCKTHYNKATGHYFGAKDPERERARLRIRTHRRKDWSRLTDITPEYEMALRAKAKRCPLCAVKMIDKPYLSTSKELDHIIPQGAGGTHTIGNVRIICRACNLARPNDGSDYTGPVTLWAEVA